MGSDRNRTHGGVGDAAGERDTALLPALMGPVAAEIDVQVPVVGFLGPAAAVLFGENRVSTRPAAGVPAVPGGPYHLLQRVDEVLQVDVVPVTLDVLQEEVVDPLSDLALENHGQNRHGQLQEEDEPDHPGELGRNTPGQNQNDTRVRTPSPQRSGLEPALTRNQCSCRTSRARFWTCRLILTLSSPTR